MLKTFIGWEIHQLYTGVSVFKLRYVGEILPKYGLNIWNTILKPMTSDTKICPALENEELLDGMDHWLYWEQVD